MGRWGPPIKEFCRSWPRASRSLCMPIHPNHHPRIRGLFRRPFYRYSFIVLWLGFNRCINCWYESKDIGMLFRFFVFSSNGMCHYCQLSWPRFSYIFSPRVAFPWLYVNGHTLQRFEFPAAECYVKLLWTRVFWFRLRFDRSSGGRNSREGIIIKCSCWNIVYIALWAKCHVKYSRYAKSGSCR